MRTILYSLPTCFFKTVFNQLYQGKGVQGEAFSPKTAIKESSMKQLMPSSIYD